MLACCELVVRCAVSPRLGPLETLAAVKAASLRLCLGDEASARACLANAPPLGLHEEEAKL